MTVRIQLRRDTSANWTSANPVLRAGEAGIETDTLKIKIGDGSTAWNSITSYANVVPGDLNTTLSDYLLVTDLSDTVAELDGNQNLLIPNDSVIFEGATPDSYELTLVATDPTADRTITLPDATGTVALTSNIPSTTDGLNEGSTNKYFTDERAQDAVAAAIASGTHTNITITYDDNANTLSFTGAQTYSDENAQDAVAAALAAGTHTNITVSYNDEENSISLTGAVTYTDENAQDAVGNSVGNGLDYDDETGAISVDPSEFALSAVGAPTGNVSMATYKITSLGTPTQATDAATKEYVDSAAEGLLTKPAVDVATTANITATYDNGTSGVGATLTIAATATLDIDGKTSWAQYDSVLFKDQSTPAQNGRYVLTTVGNANDAWVFTRCGLCDEADEIPGAYMFVLDGTLNGQTSWVLHVDNPTTFVVGTDDIDAYQFSGAGTYSAGTGLTLTGTVFSINTGTTVDLNTAQTLTNKTLTSPILTTPNLGTPSALTLTNATGLPVSGITPSTSAALGVGSLELGHASDTTLSRAAAGRLAVEGVNVVTVSSTDTLTNKTLTSPVISTISNTGTLTLPTSTDTLVGRATTDTLTYKTIALGSNTISGTIAEFNTALTDADFATLAGTETFTNKIIGTTSTTTVNTNSATTIDTIALNAFTTVKYIVSIKQGSKVRSSEIIAQTDGSSVDYSEFGVVETGGPMNGILVSSSVSSTNCVLQVTITDAVLTNATVKIQKVLI